MSKGYHDKLNKFFTYSFIKWEQFANINQYMMDNFINKATAGAFNLLSMVEIMVEGDLEQIEKMWKELGVFIGQLWAKRLTEERAAAYLK